MSKRILFDHQKFSTQRYGGISRYFSNIIQSIKQTGDFDYTLGVLASNCHYIQNEHQPLNKFGNYLKNPSLAYKINKAYCEHLLKKDAFDIFHPTYYDPYFLDKVKKPVVVTIHDMTYERLPEYFWAHDNLTNQKRLNIERADKIIAISETTKKDLLKYSNVDPAKVEVIYHGIPIEGELIMAPVPNLPENYVLFVGDRGGYKNFSLFMNAYKALAKKYPDIKAVITGGGTLGIAETELIYRLKLTGQVMHYNVTDEQLNFLYNKALAFVYPSLCEGFGLPILEAFKANCPIILSDTDCFEEIGAQAALFFNKYEWEDLFTKMDKLVNSATLRSELITKGTTRLADFPLEKSIQETFAVYQKLLPA